MYIIVDIKHLTCVEIKKSDLAETNANGDKRRKQRYKIETKQVFGNILTNVEDPLMHCH